MAARCFENLELLDNLERNVRHVRRQQEFDYNQYNDEQFRMRYRLTKEAFAELLELLRPDLNAHNRRGNPIPVDIQVLLTLRFYATGTLQLACGDLCYITQPSASRIIKKVSEAIARLKPQYISFPQDNLLAEAKLKFWRIGCFPGVVGTIDCTHIKIPCPGSMNAELYRNRKGYFSINVQAVCGPDLEIQNIVARWPGSVHDARIFDNSRLCAQFERGDINGILLGDAGYPCRPYLMTPLANPQTLPERKYNTAHLRTRNSVERMFGTWKRLFPCLSTGLRTKLATSLTIIVATAVLYNFVRKRNDPTDEHIPEIEDNEEAATNIDNPVRGLGNAARRALIQQHFQ